MFKISFKAERISSVIFTEFQKKNEPSIFKAIYYTKSYKKFTLTAKASARVTASGKPSGTATTITVIACIR